MDARDGDAQAEYAVDPALQGLLSRAAQSPTVHRERADDGNDADDATTE